GEGASFMRYGSIRVRSFSVFCLALFGLASVARSGDASVARSGDARVARSSEPLDDRLGARIMPLLLLTRHDVQVDLGLNSELVSAATRASVELYRKALGLRGRTGPAVLAARRAIDEEQTNWLNAHLTAPGQLQRLSQIELQWEGPSAMI